jgi:hypothetical protein
MRGDKNSHTIKACQALLLMGLGDTHLRMSSDENIIKMSGVRSHILLIDFYLLFILQLLHLRYAPMS